MGLILRQVKDNIGVLTLNNPARLAAMRKNIRRFVLPPRRSHRRYPREARMTKTQYPVKKMPLRLN